MQCNLTECQNKYVLLLNDKGNLKLCASLPASARGLLRSWRAILCLRLSQPLNTHPDPANQHNCLLFAGNNVATLGDPSQHADVVNH